jgi:site-specific DNA recombinase
MVAVSDSGSGLEHERRQVELALKQVRIKEDRITQAYANEAMDLKRYKTEMDKLRARIKELDGIARDLERRSEQERGAESALQQLQTFCHRVSEGLDRMSFEERQELLRLVVDRITVEDETVRIETVIPQGDDYSQLRTRHGEPVEPPRSRVNRICGAIPSSDRLRMSG